MSDPTKEQVNKASDEFHFRKISSFLNQTLKNYEFHFKCCQVNEASVFQLLLELLTHASASTQALQHAGRCRRRPFISVFFLILMGVFSSASPPVLSVCR